MNAVKKGLSIVRHIESLYGEHSSIFSVTLQRSSWVLSVHGSSAPGVGGADGGGVGGGDGGGGGGDGSGTHVWQTPSDWPFQVPQCPSR